MRKTASFLCLLLAGSIAAIAQNTGIGTTSPTDQLHTTGSVRFQNYRGYGTRLMYVDSAGRITQPPSPGAIFSNNTPVAIPDNGCSSNTGATSIINVTGQPANVLTANIAVRLGIVHPNDDDLVIYLFAPNGSILLLASNPGVSAANYPGTIFTDVSPIPFSYVAPPFTGRYKPVGLVFSQCLLTGTVSTFGGINGGNINPNGAWVLKVFDNTTGNTGTLTDWQITFDGQEAFGTGGVTGVVPYFNNGALALSAISVLPGNGGVGINTPVPQYTLDVNGTVRASTGLVVNVGLVSNGVLAHTGNVSFNTGTPAAGKVLTSTNMYGDATWQTPSYSGAGFLALVNGTTTVPSGAAGVTVPYALTSGSGLSGSSFNDGGFSAATNSYTAPTAGVYHFEASVGLTTAGAPANTTFSLNAMKTSASVTSLQQKYSQYVLSGSALPLTMAFSFQLKLLAGDIVYLNFSQNSGVSQSISAVSGSSYFSGHRVY